MSHSRTKQFKITLNKLVSKIQSNKIDIKKEEDTLTTLINEIDDVQTIHEIRHYIKRFENEEESNIAELKAENSTKELTRNIAVGMGAGAGIGFFVKSNISLGIWGGVIGAAGLTFFHMRYVKSKSPLLKCLLGIQDRLQKREQILAPREEPRPPLSVLRHRNS